MMRAVNTLVFAMLSFFAAAQLSAFAVEVLNLPAYSRYEEQAAGYLARHAIQLAPGEFERLRLQPPQDQDYRNVYDDGSFILGSSREAGPHFLFFKIGDAPYVVLPPLSYQSPCFPNAFWDLYCGGFSMLYRPESQSLDVVDSQTHLYSLFEGNRRNPDGDGEAWWLVLVFLAASAVLLTGAVARSNMDRGK